ncbi:hypothetical protein AVEN_234436-1 [Araneus ventricosus]|uniref:Reverse transcriptase domain-containing protein n=1 Tax=Araneus ventricosus TaxID=182803 RepID=A0A4Y2A8N8_ARAVE|nr:hypothetical protein AVEN_234436-1 [Araneus ventricosus]
MFELETVLYQAHETSPGPDGVTYNMLRHLNTTFLSNQLLLCNRIWTEQKYPSQWHEAIVISILKPGKDPSNPLHYRPIALTSCLCKTLERMVNSRLIFELENKGASPRCRVVFVEGGLILTTSSFWKPKYAMHLSGGTTLSLYSLI